MAQLNDHYWAHALALHQSVSEHEQSELSLCELDSATVAALIMALQLHDYPTDLKAAWRGCKTFAVASQFVFWLKCSILVLKTFWGCQAQATILYNEKMISDNLRAKPTPKTANIKCPVSTMVPNSFGTHLQILALNRNHCQIIISTCRAKAKATALLKQTQIARKDHHALYKGPVFPFCGCLDYPYCDPFGLMDHSL